MADTTTNAALVATLDQLTYTHGVPAVLRALALALTSSSDVHDTTRIDRNTATMLNAVADVHADRLDDQANDRD